MKKNRKRCRKYMVNKFRNFLTYIEEQCCRNVNAPLLLRAQKQSEKGCLKKMKSVVLVHYIPIRITVKTSPFHGGNTGSIPVGVIYHSDNRSIVAKRMIKLCILFYYV